MQSANLHVEGVTTEATRQVRVLVVADSAEAAEAPIRQLQAAGHTVAWERADSTDRLQAALERGTWDIVLCNHELPACDAVRAAELLRSLGSDVPLIVVARQVGEEFAVSVMRAGAQDVVSRQHLGRLAPAVERELRERGQRAARRRAEEERLTLLEIARDITGTLDLAAICDRVHRRAGLFLRAREMVTFCWDATRSGYHVAATRLVPDATDRARSDVRFVAGDPVVHWLASGQSLLLNDLDAQTLVPHDLSQRFRAGRMVAAPLVLHGRPVGALVALAPADARPFGPEDLAFLEGVAQQLGRGVAAAALHRAREAEAGVAVALARVGEECIARLGQADLLQHLCRLTTEFLGCDVSHTLLYDSPAGIFRVVAGHGDPPGQWEELRELRLGAADLRGVVARLGAREVAHVVWHETDDALARVVARPLGVASSLWVALRRGSELIGLHSADYRVPAPAPAPPAERLLAGIGHLGSLALDRARALEELERATTLRTEFVATMSHELRTPLNTITGYIDLLLEGEYGELTADQAEIVRRVERNAAELLELINATLDVSRIEAGRVVVREQTVDVGAVLRELDEETRPLRQDKPAVEFEWVLSPRLQPIRTDRAKLKVIVKNLVANAIKFTEAGRVTVLAHPRGGGVEIAVRDTGIGIPPQAHALIFEPFRQLDSSVTRRYSGVGLGLYIVRRLVGLLGGTIEVESAVGRGSTFRVWIPAGVPAREG